MAADQSRGFTSFRIQIELISIQITRSKVVCGYLRQEAAKEGDA